MTGDPERVVLLVGGDAVYLYAVGDANIDVMEAVLDVAYPAGEVIRRTLPVSTWEGIRPKVVADGVAIIDVRSVRAPLCPGCGALPKVMTDEQGFCGTDDCAVFCWNLADDPATFKARAHRIDLPGPPDE